MPYDCTASAQPPADTIETQIRPAPRRQRSVLSVPLARNAPYCTGASRANPLKRGTPCDGVPIVIRAAESNWRSSRGRSREDCEHNGPGASNCDDRRRVHCRPGDALGLPGFGPLPEGDAGIIEAFADGAFEKGSAYAYAKLRAAALWLGPGIEPDGERMSEILEATVSPELKDDLLGFSEKQSSNHPHEAHWYLAMIGVDPAYQGRGLGGALLNHGLAISDKSGLPSYLEATSEGNRRLYERHGFVVVNEIQYGSSPAMWGMWREAR